MQEQRSLYLALIGGTTLAALLPLAVPIARNLEYEYATLNAYACFMIFAGLGLWWRVPEKDLKLSSHLIALSLSWFASYLPGYLAFALKICPCLKSEFSFWWVVQTFPHLLLAQGLTLVFWWLRQRAVKRRLLIAGLSLSTSMLLLQLALMFWQEPQKRTTHLLAGFIHGAIYDNWIPLDEGILWLRLSHAVLGLGCIVCILSRSPRLRVTVLIASLFGIGVCLEKAEGYASTQHGLSALIKEMPLTREGPYFTLHYAPLHTAAEEPELENLYRSALFHSEDLAQKLLVYHSKVQVFVYPSREQKKLWFGGDGTDITDIWTPSVHITLEPWPHSTLRHEFVHALASDFAFFGLGFHPNMAFTEGLAVALAPQEDDISLHRGAASLLATQRVKDIQTMFSPLFWKESGRRAYTITGSLITYMLEAYGIGTIRLLYSGEEWDDIFSKDNETVINAWQDFLKKRYPEQKREITAEALYRYPGLLDELCPHSKALLARVPQSWLTRLRQPQGWVVERDFWPWRLRIERDRATVLQVLRSHIHEAFEAEDEVRLRDLLQKVEKQQFLPPKTLEDVDLMLMKQDLMIALGQYEKALEEAKKDLATLTNYGIGEQHVRQLWSRVLLLQEGDRQLSLPWLKLLAGHNPIIPSWRKEFKPWIIRYLYLRNHRFQKSDRLLLNFFTKLTPPKEIPHSFAVEWYRFLGLQWMSMEEYQKAADAFLQAAAIAPEGKTEALTLYAREFNFLAKRYPSSQP